MYRASPQFCQIVRYAASLITLFTDLACLRLKIFALFDTHRHAERRNITRFSVVERRINQVDASISKIHFCPKTLYVSVIFCAHHQELSTVHSAIGTLHAGYVTAS